MIINDTNGKYGETLYQVTLSTWFNLQQTYEVYAYNETEAVDIVADFVEDKGLFALYETYDELTQECADGETPDEYADANGLTCCGNHGIYVRLVDIKEVQQ